MGWPEETQIKQKITRIGGEIDCLFLKNDIKGDPKYAYLFFLRKKNSSNENYQRYFIGESPRNMSTSYPRKKLAQNDQS